MRRREDASSQRAEELFHGIYTQGSDYVWKTLRRLGVPEKDREDALSEVFLRVHRAVHSYDPARPLFPWLFAFAFRVAHEQRRKEGREILHKEGEVEIASSSRSPEREFSDRERVALVHAALSDLDFDRRVVFVAHELDELPIPEVARMLGIPEGTAYTRLRAARADFARAVAARSGKGAP